MDLAQVTEEESSGDEADRVEPLRLRPSPADVEDAAAAADAAARAPASVLAEDLELVSAGVSLAPAPVPQARGTEFEEEVPSDSDEDAAVPDALSASSAPSAPHAPAPLSAREHAFSAALSPFDIDEDPPPSSSEDDKTDDEGPGVPAAGASVTAPAPQSSAPSHAAVSSGQASGTHPQGSGAAISVFDPIAIDEDVPSSEDEAPAADAPLQAAAPPDAPAAPPAGLSPRPARSSGERPVANTTALEISQQPAAPMLENARGSTGGVRLTPTPPATPSPGASRPGSRPGSRPASASASGSRPSSAKGMRILHLRGEAPPPLAVHAGLAALATQQTGASQEATTTETTASKPVAPQADQVMAGQEGGAGGAAVTPRPAEPEALATHAVSAVAADTLHPDSDADREREVPDAQTTPGRHRGEEQKPGEQEPRQQPEQVVPLGLDAGMGLPGALPSPGAGLPGMGSARRSAEAAHGPGWGGGGEDDIAAELALLRRNREGESGREGWGGEDGEEEGARAGAGEGGHEGWGGEEESAVLLAEPDDLENGSAGMMAPGMTEATLATLGPSEQERTDAFLDAVVDMRPWEFKLLDVAGGQLEEFDRGLVDGEEAAMAYQMKQRARLYEIQQLKTSLEHTEVREYAEELDTFDFGDEAITVGSISKHRLAEQHRRVEEEGERVRREQRRLHRRRQDILARQENEAMEAVVKQRQDLARRRTVVEEERLARDRTRARSMRNALRTAQDKMVRALRSRGVALKEQLGVLEVDSSRGHLLPSARQWRLSAALRTAPRPIKIRIDTCRSLRDKVQRGHYVVVATLLERVAGKPLRFSGPGTDRLTSTRTRPVAHNGRYFDSDLLIDECLFLLCPPDAQLSPSLTLLLEIYQCKSRLTPFDRCVGWAVFPLVAANFELVSGKFKAPVIRGEYSTEMKLHRSIEEHYSADLDRWLGNIYFKISRMSRYLHNDSEYAVRLQYTSQLLGLDPPLAHIEALQADSGGAAEEGRADGAPEGLAGGGVGPGANSALTSVVIESGSPEAHRGDAEAHRGDAPGSAGGVRETGGAAEGQDDGEAAMRTEAAAGGELQQLNGIHARYASSRALGEEEGQSPGWWTWWVRGKERLLSTRETARREGALDDERVALLAGSDSEQGASKRGRPGVMAGVEWEKLFETEKAKVEAGEDPEGDGLTDVSDTEDEEEMEPWQSKDAAARALSRHLMLRTEGGAALRLPASGQELVSRTAAGRSARVRSVVGRGKRRERVRGGSGEDASGSESDTGYADELDPPHAEKRTPRPIDHGRKEFYQQYSLDAARGDRGSGRDGQRKGAGGDEGVEDAVARAAAAGDIPDVEVEDDEQDKKGGKGRVQQASNGIAEVGKNEGGVKVGGRSRAEVKDMMQRSNKGKSSDRIVPQDARPEALQLVRYDHRLGNYLNSVASASSRRRNRHTLFLVYEAANDLALLDFPRARFWGSMLLVLVALEIRVHVHYAAVFAWLFLSSRPIYETTPGPLRWSIKYSPMSTTSEVEIGALCAGPVAVFGLWLVIAGVVWALSKITRVDGVTYRFVGLFGLVAALDWVVVLIVDLATMSYRPCHPLWQQAEPPADNIEARAWLKAAGERCTVEAYRLWFHFRFNEGDGSIAPVIIVIIYVGMLAIFAVTVYTYFLNIHGGGRILDLYRRLTCKEGTLFMPFDVEVSPQELLLVIQASRRWRGQDGGRRRLIVTDIEIEYLPENAVMRDGEVEEGDSRAQGSIVRVLTHLALYTCPRQGAKQLHRHFVRLHNGTIVEIIGDEVQYIVSPALLQKVQEIVSDFVQDEGAAMGDRKFAS